MDSNEQKKGGAKFDSFEKRSLAAVLLLVSVLVAVLFFSESYDKRITAPTDQYPSRVADSLEAKRSLNEERAQAIAEARNFASGVEASGLIAEKKAEMIRKRLRKNHVSDTDQGIGLAEFKVAIRNAYLQDAKGLQMLRNGFENTENDPLKIYGRRLDEVREWDRFTKDSDSEYLINREVVGYLFAPSLNPSTGIRKDIPLVDQETAHRSFIFVFTFPSTKDVRKQAESLKNAVRRGIIAWTELPFDEKGLKAIVDKVSYLNYYTNATTTPAEIRDAVKNRKVVTWREIGYRNEVEFDAVRSNRQ